MTRLLRLLVCAACTASACVGSQPPAPAADARLVAETNRAIGHLGRYDFQAAVDVLTPLAAAYPGSAATSFNLAVALINRQRGEDAPEAERRLRALLDRPEVAPRVEYTLGLLLLYQGRDAEAVPLLSAAAEAAPDDAFAAYFAGQARLAAAPGDAAVWFEKARALDPLLRSASYGVFQALQRAGRPAEATAALDDFQALDTDPRARLAEFKYTRMGPLAEALFIEGPSGPAPAIEGPPFEREAVVQVLPDAAPGATPAITVADIDGDGALDLFVSGTGERPANTSLLRRGRTWQPAPHASAGRCLASAPRSGATRQRRAGRRGPVRGDGRTASGGRSVRTTGGTSRPPAAPPPPASTRRTARWSTPTMTAIWTCG
ncbi:MAG: hypothetical protein R2708_27705 [Vicinamibacterales bacterium]